MKNLSFARVNIKTYNTFLCIVLPLVTMALLYPHASFFMNLKTEWIFSLEFLKLIVIIIFYAMPVAYFLTKAYAIASSGDDKNHANTILGFIGCCALLLPLAFIAYIVFAKISFLFPLAFNAVIVFIYFRSLKASKAVKFY